MVHAQAWKCLYPLLPSLTLPLRVTPPEPLRALANTAPRHPNSCACKPQPPDAPPLPHPTKSPNPLSKSSRGPQPQGPPLFLPPALPPQSPRSHAPAPGLRPTPAAAPCTQCPASSPFTPPHTCALEPNTYSSPLHPIPCFKPLHSPTHLRPGAQHLQQPPAPNALPQAPPPITHLRPDLKHRVLHHQRQHAVHRVGHARVVPQSQPASAQSGRRER